MCERKKFQVAKEELSKLYVADPCAQRIADLLGVCRTTILYWLNKYNIQVVKCGGRNLKDLTGRVFGQLTVIERVLNYGGTQAKWLCKCSCGNYKEVLKTPLLHGLTISCGCYKKISQYRGYEEISGCYWGRVKQGAEKRKLEMVVTIEQAWKQFIKQNRKCVLTGLPICFVRDFTRQGIQQTASLDRIDNNKGYIINNIQWVHKIINIMRSDNTVDEFIYYCRLVSEHSKESPKELISV